MIFNPPYSLQGETGKTLDAGWYTLESLGVHLATVTLRSLAEDELVFTQRATPGRAIADDGQWLNLADGDGKVILSGIAKRTFVYPQNLYQFSVANVYRGLTQTPLTDAITLRPYVLYTGADLSETLLHLLNRANDIGLPIRAPDSLPEMFAVPKMAFISASCGSALEDALKWLPDAASRMDYASSPPTLRLTRRDPSAAVLLDLDSPGHGVTALTLAPMPEARALSVSVVYAVRDGAMIINYLTQKAGDDSAEAHRSLSIYLSGHERTDGLTSEALVTAGNALTTARAALDAANAAIVASAATVSATLAATLAAIPADGRFDAGAYAAAHDTALATGTTAGVTWQTGTVKLWNYTVGMGISATPSTTSVSLFYATAAAPTVAVSPAGVVAPGTFTDAQLATAGASKTAGLICGQMMFQQPLSGNHGYPTLLGGYAYGFNYWSTPPSTAYRTYDFATLAGTSVDFLSMSVPDIMAALRSAAYAAVTPTPALGTFIDQAAFVEAPADLAANYFAAQDWLPYSGQLTFTPTAPVVPEPGEFVGITASGLPSEFATMATPVASLAMDLDTGASTVTLGPSARMTYANLQDRLRIPAADNTTPV